jgi:hypothetical protein
MCLPTSALILRGSSYDEINKPATLKHEYRRVRIPSSISRYVFGTANQSLINLISFLQAKCIFSEKTKLVQASKGTALGIRLLFTFPLQKKVKDKAVSEPINKLAVGIWDRTASTDSRAPEEVEDPIPDKRRRSRRNSVKISNDGHSLTTSTKGDSFKSPLTKNKMSKLEIPLQESSLRRVVRKELDMYRNTGSGKLNGIIRIIAEPSFLMTCYRLIKSNSGNMTKGSTSETLDGINNEWFTKTGKDLLEGRYQFKPARQVMRPKANSDKMRSLSIGSPRDKIVQKAIQVVLSAIYEHEFLDVSHGFRPDKSTATALNVLHQRAGPYS